MGRQGPWIFFALRGVSESADQVDYAPFEEVMSACARDSG